MTADDLAVQRAKEKLGQIKFLPGYLEAMEPPKSDSPAMFRTMMVFAVLFIALAVVSKLYVETTWLRWLLLLVFVALALISLMGGIGSAQEKAPEAWPVAVLAKTKREKGQGADPDHVVSILDANGGVYEASTIESTYDLLRAGDVGVAHVRKTGDALVVVAFVRL